MIIVKDNVKEGDLVYAWFSPIKEKAGKKHDEHEFRLSTKRTDWVKLSSIGGHFDVIFTGSLLNNWDGEIRKA